MDETTPLAVETETRVCIVEDELETREALGTRIDNAPGLRCVGTYATGEAALRGIGEAQPHVALVDIRLPGISGIEVVARLRAHTPTIEALMLTTYEESDLIFDSLRAGAKGYLLKNVQPAELIQAIQQIRLGGAPMSVQIARKVVDYFDRATKPGSPDERLTKREHEVLELLARGFLYKEISSRLGISLHTVKVHLHTIYEKLHVQSRTEAVVKYLGRSTTEAKT
jgi:DNA-binding NarL/FixJ family response regulator